MLGGPRRPGAGGRLVTIDLDAMIVTAYSDKEEATPTWKKTFGFHPITAWDDHGPGGSAEPLAMLLRPRNAGFNTVSDRIEATRRAASCRISWAVGRWSAPTPVAGQMSSWNGWQPGRGGCTAR